jgi:hypothetical protein
MILFSCPRDNELATQGRRAGLTFDAPTALGDCWRTSEEQTFSFFHSRPPESTYCTLETRTGRNACATNGTLVEEVGLFVGDALEEGLELEPAGEVRAHEGVSVLGGFVGNFVGLAGGFGE